MPQKILLFSSKISWLIFLSVITSENSLTLSFLSETIKEVQEVAKMLVLLWKTFLIWLMTTLQAISKFSWRRFGLFNSTDGLWVNAMEALKNKWTIYWRQKVIGKLFKLSTTLSINLKWMMLKVKDSERSISTILVTFTQIEPRIWTTLKNSKIWLIIWTVPHTSNTSSQFQTQWKLMLSQRLTWILPSTTNKRKISLEDTQWLISVNSTMEHSMLIWSWKNRKLWTSLN